MVHSNREEFGVLWDVLIHILGIRTECACWKAGGPVCRPYGGDVVRPGGVSGRPRPTKEAAGASPRPASVQSIDIFGILSLIRSLLVSE